MSIRALAAAPLLALAAALVFVGLALAGSSRSVGAPAGPGYGPLFAVLLGGEEVGTDGRANAGDPNGEGAFSFAAGGNRICFGLVVKAIAKPVAAHIHRGLPGQNGPVVVTLRAPSAGDPGTSSGCVSGLRPALVRDILHMPQYYYVNVHTGDYPGGAIRGQLF